MIEQNGISLNAQKENDISKVITFENFKNDDINYNWFFERLKDNALKKYNAFYLKMY